MSLGCPRCGGPIRCSGEVTGEGVTITLNQLDVLRHAACFDGPHNGGEPLPIPRAA